ncbi:maleylpyruvate isomerase family mycothiol-dependent enzyme [Actinoplanes oblitus]|uniref:Maleylpyruvate isomerase family mycothiol-dependent enzyme n=1 Tax=Actinoplanes oblitus TaxID=3040509 RepID=A0ABY8W7E2_9ACTN|nr:maleylpyruvate isomerase family mycothiol-dependent enzyme [Actinoplanes oblitus]WIM93242.1 maleylpyruvate isomerase family mycothiol-dependent enzyme [Actinoplanes oblitus]
MQIDHLALLREELELFQECLGGELSAPVEHCGDWTLRELAAHVAEGNLWVVAAVRERHGRHASPPAPEDIAPHVAETSRRLVEALSVDPATEAWTFWPPCTVGFWRRRRWLETLVHRWDAQHALGIPSRLDPELCGDGVAEVFDTFAPRQVKLGRMAEPAAAVRFTADDLGRSWVFGPGEPVVELRGPAPDLMLALWNRKPWSELSGDAAAARAALPGPLVP